MPVLLAWLGELIATSIGAWCIQALVGVGVGLATYKLAIGPAKDAMIAQFNEAGQLAAYIGFLGIDKAITIVISAWLGRMAVSALKVRLVKKV